MVQGISNLIKVAGQTVERSTLVGLQNASAKSGVSFQYLVAKAAQESSLQADASAKTSSAVGLFQFTKGTWLDMMRKHGALYGYGDLAAKITVADDGKTAVADPAAEKRLMALRGNAEASALMAAEYARDNATSLYDALGRKVDAADLYLAHFLGASGASQLLNAAEKTPDASAAALLPGAAKANTSVFYTADGRARTAGEVVALIRERFTGQMDRYAEVADTVTGTAETLIPERTQAALPAQFNDARGAMIKAETRDPSKAMISHFIMEELAKMIAMKPMMMGDDGEEEQPDQTLVSSNGFQGADFAAAMSKALAKTAGDAPAEPPKPRASDAMRTYDMLNAVPTPGAPFLPLRRDPR